MTTKTPDESLTLAELMFHAEQFCLRVEAAVADCAPQPDDDEELRSKIGQCRTIIAHLQELYDQDKLTIKNPSIRADFRFLVISVLWVAFRARHAMDFRLFRRVVLIESGFTYLLAQR